MIRIFSLLVLTTFLFTACGKKDDEIVFYEYKSTPSYEPNSSKSEKEKIAEFKSGLLKKLEEGKKEIIHTLQTKPNYSPQWDDKVNCVLSSLIERIKDYDAKTLEELQNYAQAEGEKSDKELSQLIKNLIEQNLVTEFKSDFLKHLDNVEEKIINELKTKNLYSVNLDNKVKNLISSLKERVKNYNAKTLEEIKDYCETESKKTVEELDNLVKNLSTRLAYRLYKSPIFKS